MSLNERNFSADWKNGNLSLYGINFKIKYSPYDTETFLELGEISEKIGTSLGEIRSILKHYQIMSEDNLICEENPISIIGPEGKETSIDPSAFVLMFDASRMDDDVVPVSRLFGNYIFIKGLFNMYVESQLEEKEESEYDENMSKGLELLLNKARVAAEIEFIIKPFYKRWEKVCETEKIDPELLDIDMVKMFVRKNKKLSFNEQFEKFMKEYGTKCIDIFRQEKRLDNERNKVNFHD